MIFYVSLLHFAESVPFDRSNKYYQDLNFNFQGERRKVNYTGSFPGIRNIDESDFYTADQPKRIRRFALFLPRRYDIRKNWGIPFKNRSYRQVLRPSSVSGIRSNRATGDDVIDRRPGAHLDLEYKGRTSPHLSANLSLQDNPRKAGVDLDLQIEDLVKEVMEEIMQEGTATPISVTEASAMPTTVQTAATEKPQRPKKPTPPRISPAYDCDLWDEIRQTCWSWRAIGDTITFGIAIGKQTKNLPSFEVSWSKHYHVRKKSRPKIERLKADNPPWNMVIGNSGLELRISPLTDTDFDANKFTATVWKMNRHRQRNFRHLIQEINFRIQIMPIDLGYVYIGEEITLNVERYVMLPAESMIFDWYLERGSLLNHLPSNMRVSKTGRSIFIRELRDDQQGVITCSVYTNSGVFMTRRRFYAQILDNAMLTRPEHQQQNLSFAVDLAKRAYRDINEVSDSDDPFSVNPGRNEGIPEDEPRVQEEDISKEKNNRIHVTDFPDYPLAVKNEVPLGLEPQNERMKSSEVIMDQSYKDVSPSKEFAEDHPFRSSSNSEMLQQQNAGMRVYHNDQLHQQTVESNAMDEIGFVEHLSNNRLPNSFQKQYEPFPVALPINSDQRDRSPHPSFRDNSVVSGALRKETPVESNVVLFPLNPTEEELKVDEEESFLVSSCSNDRECSSHAWCEKKAVVAFTGYCKCGLGYRGNGIFCWEDLYNVPNEGQLMKGESSAGDAQFFSALQRQKLPYTSSQRKVSQVIGPDTVYKKQLSSFNAGNQMFPESSFVTIEGYSDSENPQHDNNNFLNGRQYSFPKAESPELLDNSGDEIKK